MGGGEKCTVRAAQEGRWGQYGLCVTPERFSVTGCRGDGRELGTGVGDNMADHRFLVIRTL